MNELNSFVDVLCSENGMLSVKSISPKETFFVCKTPTAKSLCRGLIGILLLFLKWMLIGSFLFCGVYFIVASPPLHLIYDVAPPAGPHSVYVPGGGFSGFWFHLGFLQSLEDPEQYEYYCFSSGCLGVVAALMNLTIDETSSAAFTTQQLWQTGSLSRFELMDRFFEELLPENENDNIVHSFRTIESKNNNSHHIHVQNNDTASDVKINRWLPKDVRLSSNSNRRRRSRSAALEEILPKVKILISNQRNGYEAIQPDSRESLKELLIQTTWIPYITGWGFFSDPTNNDYIYDGGFSRVLHPLCQHRLDLPLIWDTLIHTFTPGLSRDQVSHLWHLGRSYKDYSLSNT